MHLATVLMLMQLVTRGNNDGKTKVWPLRAVLKQNCSFLQLTCVFSRWTGQRATSLLIYWPFRAQDFRL